MPAKFAGSTGAGSVSSLNESLHAHNDITATKTASEWFMGECEASIVPYSLGKPFRRLDRRV
jgi:hypothetical protein